MSAAASPAIRPAMPAALPLAAVGGLAVFGVLLGVSLALGELDAFIVSLAVISTIAVLIDFRVGAVLLILFMPIEASRFFPHSIGGITGLNPINILIAGTLASFVLRWNDNAAGRFVSKPLLGLLVLPMLVGGLIGAQNVDRIPDLFYDGGVVNFTDAFGYYRDIVVKPLLMVVAAVLVGGALAKSHKPERFIWPIMLSVWLMAGLAIGFVLYEGASLGELASASARKFFSALGLHANDLGRLYAVAYALLLFTWFESRNAALKTMLLVTMGVITLALLFTFSRGAFLGFVIVNLLFLLWKFNSRLLVLALAVGAVGVFFMPGAVIDRVSMGFSTGNWNTVSAGRIENIWLPLLPEVLQSPLWGHGLQSTMWSDALKNGQIFQVTHPHNAYLEALLDVGIIGLALLVAFYLHIWRRFRALGSNAYLSPQMRGFYQGAAAALVCFAVTGFAGSSLLPRPEYVFLWIAIGMMYGQLARRPAG